MSDPVPSLIALDWGTSSLRAWLLDDHGHVLDANSAAQGILQVPERDFAAAYRRILQFDRVPHEAELPALACGMIGSRGGWQEAPYKDCPATLDALAEGLVAADTAQPTLWLVPGVLQRGQVGRGTLPDVMRGEETQVLGALALDPGLAEDALLVLPGTHCKWVQVRAGRIEAFTTYMTGELFALLRDHSILGRPAQAMTGVPDAAAFEQGLDTARASGTSGLSAALFSARSRLLVGELSAVHSLDYLSGLLIGEELRSVLSRRCECPPLRLIGDARLCERYRWALRRFGVDDVAIIEGAAVTGLWRIATTAGLVSGNLT